MIKRDVIFENGISHSLPKRDNGDIYRGGIEGAGSKNAKFCVMS